MLTLLGAVPATAPTELWMPAMFSDHMVLQRDIPAPIFGSARPGQEVDVIFDGRRYRTEANNQGRWLVRLRPQPAGGPHTLIVRAGDSRTFRDVMFGEVWLASGQSNMEWKVAWSADPERDLFDADSRVRMFTIARQSREVPAEDVGGSWVPATRRTVFGFSAVAYTFAKELHRVLKVPVGILHSSWSATPAESWVRREALLADPTFANAVRRYEDSLGNFTRRQDTYHRALRQYSTSVFKKDEKNTGYHDGWADPNHDTAFWTRVQLPGGWEQAQGLRIDGAVWYRRNIMVPEDWIGKELVLELGTIDDYDNTYFNGFPVGSIRDEVAEPGKVKRVYRIAPGLVRRGMNTIAVRVFDRFGAGGFTGDVDDMKLRLAGNTDDRIMDLAGSWFQRIERRLEQTDTATLSTMPTTPVGPGHPQAPGGLWNGMIAPLIPFGIRGVIWYQGESNATRASQYRRLFPMLINDWRRQWGQGDMPFYYVQLANFRNRKPDPGDSDWAELREAQFQALRLPNTGMAVAIDVGEANDIHPKNKREVGRRLALQALARDYDQKVLRTGPLYSSNRVQGTSIQVFFEGVGERLKTSDGKNVRGFAIAGADRKFVWAEARISGNSVLVSSPRVPKPVAVRYGWADNPDVNLVDSSGLPASPFRTDDWPGITR